MSWRREPFRPFFTLGIVLAALGVIPWLLFSFGELHAWPAELHGLVMTQGFLAALAVGFLGTMLPRRAGIEPMSRLELGLASAGILTLAGGLVAGRLVVAEAGFLLVVGVLGRYVVAGVRRGQGRPAPASFVLMPLGVAAGVAGAVLLMVPVPWAYALGRMLAQQGLILLLVLAIVPMLAPIVADGQPPADLPRAWRLAHLAVGLIVLASFAVELWWSVPGGLALRGLVVAAQLAITARPWRLGSRRGLHRVLFRVAVGLTPLGLLAAAIVPAARASLLHMTFIGGFALLALSVSVHVTLLHTGRDAQAEKTSWQVAVAGGATVLAALVRAEAERFGANYVMALALAAALWLVATLVWGAFVIPKLLAR